MSAGHAALEVLQVFRPDIAMIDIDMPEMDGHEVAQRIRELPAFTSLPLVAFTACEPVEVFGHRPHSHFDFHLPKPFRLNELKSLVRIALDRQALRNNRSGDGMALA
jgi:CheY-like chemotaxis protein